MSKHSKTMPKGEVRPLGTPRPKKVKSGDPIPFIHGTGPAEKPFCGATSRTALTNRTDKTSAITCPSCLAHIAKKGVDSPLATVVDSLDVGASAIQPAANDRSRMMTLTLKGLSKNRNDSMYTGTAMVQRFKNKSFVGGIPPQTIQIPDGIFAAPKVKAPKVPKVKLTAEERKAQRAARPKPTEAERIAQAEAKLAKRKAKLQAAQLSL